jgi:hypothetical protein
MNSEHFNIFIVNEKPQGSLPAFLNQCDAFAVSLGTIALGTHFNNSFQEEYGPSRSFTIHLSGATVTESISFASSSASASSGISGQSGWLPILRVQGYGQSSDSLGNYDARVAVLEQILSQAGIILPPSMTASLGLECGVYVLSSSAHAASSTMNDFVTYLRERLDGYENVSVRFIGQNDPPGNSSLPTVDR